MRIFLIIITLNLFVGFKSFSMKTIVPSILFRKSIPVKESCKVKLIKKLELLDKKLGIYIFSKEENKSTEQKESK